RRGNGLRRAEVDERELLPADRDPVAPRQRPRRGDALAVDVRAVCAPEVRDRDARFIGADLGVATRGELVVDRDLAARVTADDGHPRPEVDLDRALEEAEARRGPGARVPDDRHAIRPYRGGGGESRLYDGPCPSSPVPKRAPSPSASAASPRPSGAT